MSKTLLIMAGGTGGHIMPGLAVAHEMRARGWRVVWMGHPERMEGELVPEHGFTLEPLRFAGVRGKGVGTLVKLPLTLFKACSAAAGVLKRVQPDVVLGMGGYVAFPGGLMAAMKRIPLVIHEQNAVAGTANRWLGKLASKTLVGFPGALPGAVMVGNPVRAAFRSVAPPEQRLAGRTGKLKLLVVGGSLGAAVLNQTIPKALAAIDEAQRPEVMHQAGKQHIDEVRKNYADAGVKAECTAFIGDMAQAMTQADLLICRAGAMTVAEVAAAGVPALFIPLPHAIDDHQTANANYLAGCGAAWLQPQREFTAEWLAQWLTERTHDELLRTGVHAQEHAQLHATEQIANACEQLVRRAV